MLGLYLEPQNITKRPAVITKVLNSETGRKHQLNAFPYRNCCGHGHSA